jgi:hypothetical protein
LYEKIGAEYELKSSNFLQGEMIDVGENSVPALGDLDANGTTDMLIGRSGRLKLGVPASITHYNNTGNFATPILQWQTNDFANLSSLGLASIKPKLIDINEDGQLDLIFIGSSATRAQLYIIYGTTTAFAASAVQTIDIRLNVGDNFELADVNNDGRLDLLIGTASGRLDLYLNQGTATAPNYQIATSGFQNITTNPSRTNLSILELANDDSGSESLLLYDDSGELRIIENYKNATSEPTFITLTNTASNINIGKKGILSSGALLGAGSLQLLVGSTQGGLFAYSIDGNSSSDVWNTLIYPNPSTDNFSILSTQSARVDLIDLSGKVLLSNHSIKANTPTKISSSNYAAGIYILRLISEKEEKRVIRILIEE